MVYIATLSIVLTPIKHVYLSHLTSVGILLANKVFIKVLPKYWHYADVLLSDLIIELSKNIGKNKHVIKPVEGK